MRKRTVRILKGIGIAVIVLGLIYAIAVAVSVVKLRRAYTDLENDGRPMNRSNVIPPTVPNPENAALLYESGMLLLRAQPAPNEDLLRYLWSLSDRFMKESLSPEELDELQRLIEQDIVTRALWAVEQGTQRRRCRFHLDYRGGFNMLMPHIPGLRELVRVLGAKACLDARAGRLDDAWNMARTQLGFADALRTEPVLLSQLVRLASIETSCETIRKICEIAPPNSEQYRSLESLLSDYETRTPLVLGLDGERLLIGEWAFNLLKSGSPKVLTADTGGEPELGEVLLSLYSAFKPLSLADHVAYLRIMGDYTQLLQQPYSPDEASAMDRKVEQMGRRLHIVTAILTPAIGRVKERYWELVAQMRITRTGLALLQYKQTHPDMSGFPAMLEALGPSDVKDPFSDGPLLYRSEADGFVLYSVGPDQKDNGGSPKQDKQETDWDIVWQFPSGRVR